MRRATCVFIAAVSAASSTGCATMARPRSSQRKSDSGVAAVRAVPQTALTNEVVQDRFASSFAQPEQAGGVPKAQRQPRHLAIGAVDHGLELTTFRLP